MQRWIYLNDSLALQLRATGYKKYKLYSELRKKIFSKEKDNDKRSSDEIITDTINMFAGTEGSVSS